MTLDKLAVITTRGFAAIHKEMDIRFGEVHKEMGIRFGEVHKEMDIRFGEVHKEMDKKFDSVGEMFEGLEQRFATKDDFKVLVDDIGLLRDEVKDNTRAVRSVISLVAEHDKEIDFLKERVGV